MTANQSKLQGMMAAIQRHQGTQPIQVLRLLNRQISTDGEWQFVYYPAVDARATIEPMSRNRIEQLGLDFTQNYIAVKAQFTLQDTRRQSAPDRIIWDGKVWFVVTSEEWQRVNGWTSAICQSLTAAPDT